MFLFFEDKRFVWKWEYVSYSRSKWYFIGKGTTYTGVWYFFPSTYMFLFRVQIALKKAIFTILVSISVVFQQL